MNKKLEMDSRFSGKVMLELEIASYMNNNRMYIGLIDEKGERFADMTANINSPCPDSGRGLWFRNNSIISQTVRRFLILATKKCRIHAACGVSQTPILFFE